jgi:hypothetical protein
MGEAALSRRSLSRPVAVLSADIVDLQHTIPVGAILYAEFRDQAGIVDHVAADLLAAALFLKSNPGIGR